MALFNFDVREELGQIEGSLSRVAEKTIKPILVESIETAGNNLHEVVESASEKLNLSIKLLSDEIHSQRQMTKDDIESLIDYAAVQFGATLDKRIETIKLETSHLINDKVQVFRGELEDAAIRSRKTMLTNASISICAAIFMAIIGFTYKRISLDPSQIDMLMIFRISLVSMSVGSGIASALTIVQRWRCMNQAKKNITTVTIGYLGILRPNGALGLFFLSVFLLFGWGWLLHLAK